MNKLIPKLRFSEFNDEFKIFSLNEITAKKISYGIVQAGPFVEGGMPYIKSKNLNTEINLEQLERTSEKIANKYKRSEVTPGDIVFSLRGNIGISQILPNSILVANLTQGTARISLSKEFIPKYLINELQTYRAKKRISVLAKGSTFQEISLEELRKLEVAVSTTNEQQKIADFLTSVDKKISILTEKHALLERYKKGVLQKLFTQETRFKDENGNDFPDWANTKFDKVFERVTQKNKENNLNVLTISAQRGLINQEKYFNKSVSAKDVTGYYLLNSGDFAYNKSYSKGYPMGAIKRLNNYDKGVVSTLYICFKSHGNQHDAFWEQYFEAGLLNREISKIAQEGARNHGLLNVSVTEFFRDITVHEPSEKEQVRIAEFLGTLDKKLKLVSQQIEQTQAFKKGLLQQMFV
jgi:type I restriction enzyme S subunit